MNVYNFLLKGIESVKAVPYGIYDIALKCGFVNIGISISVDTAFFACGSLPKWWKEEGK